MRWKVSASCSTRSSAYARRLNPELGIEGVVLTMFDERTNLAQQVMTELKNYFGEKLCSTTVPRNIRLAEAPSHGKAALVYDPRSKGAESYIRLAKEIIERQPSAVSAQPSAETLAAEGAESRAGAGGARRFRLRWRRWTRRLEFCISMMHRYITLMSVDIWAGSALDPSAPKSGASG